MTRAHLTRCRSCNARVLIVQLAPEDRWMPVERHPVSTDTDAAGGAWVVVENRRAYRPRELAEIVMVSRSIALVDAHEVVRTEFPWHRRHACPYEQPQPQQEAG